MQTEMSILEVIDREYDAAQEAARLERLRLAEIHFSMWNPGTLTLEQINRQNHPDWAWDDYAI